MRNFLMLLLSLSILGCAEERSDPKDLTNYIPEDAGVILDLQDPNLFFSHLNNNEFLKNNAAHPLFENTRQQLSFLQHFQFENPAILAFSATENNERSYTYIYNGVPSPANLDSLQNKTVETLTSDFAELKRYTLDENITYTATLDSIFLVSDSRQNLESIFRQKGRENLPHLADFEKALKASSSNSPVLYINHQRFPGLFSSLFPFANLEQQQLFSNWTSLDTEITQSGIKLNGITTATDSLPKIINLFQGVGTTENELARIAPNSSQGFFSLTYNDYPVLQENLNTFNGQGSNDPETENLLSSTSEAGMIYLNNASVFVLKSFDTETSRTQLVPQAEVVDEFHDLSIYNMAAPFNFEILKPLIEPENLQYFLFLENFILFSAEIEPLREIVRSFQNENTLGNSEAFSTTQQSLSTESSLLWVSNNKNFKEKLGTLVAEDQQEATAALDFSQFPFAALQFVYQSDFAHVHAVLEKSNNTFQEEGIRQTATISLDAELAAPPVFFTNHRTNGLDIAVQDVENTLYLISEKGEIHWKKNLDSRIIGPIQQIDIYKNGRIQLAFATHNSVQVLDRNGNQVKPFPLSFRDAITQPLALFDYDNRRDYRFVVVQNRDVFMYDSKGRSVRGFKFNKASSEIVQPPKHIRIGNKDYILIAEASGKLNILHRSGRTRVPVKESLDFSGNEWYEYNNSFVSTNNNGELVSISQAGNVTREALSLAPNHQIDATAKTLVTLSDNQLSIKGKKITLDYGLYTEPRIFYINNKIYISVTDTQAQRVFLFDSNAELLPNFPVYGNSTIDLGNADSDDNLELVVQGDDDTVIVYELN